MANEYRSNIDDNLLDGKSEHRLGQHDIDESNQMKNTEKNDKPSVLTANSIEVLNQIPKRAVCNINTPEKIILCIDSCQQDNSLFELDPGTTFTSVNILKRITEFFLYSKQAINHNTEFALVILTETEPIWVHNFTKNILEIIVSLDSFEKETCKADEFDLSLLFDLVESQVSLSSVYEDHKLTPPSNIVRLILMYNRSHCMPKFVSGTKTFMALKEHPYFTIDVLYSHEESCPETNKCAQIYDALQSLDNGYSFIFEVAKNGAKIHECGAKFLAHPFQRPLQKNCSYTFNKFK